MNRTKLFSRTVFLFLFCCALLLGCAKGGQEVETGTAYTIFYLNAAGNQLSGTEYRTETAGQDELIQELLGCMTQVPPDLDCLSAIPERIEKITYRVEENVLYLYADANYALMGAVEEILCRAALVKTLTQIPGIDYLSIYCAEQPITDAAGNPVGMLSASDFVDSIRDVNSFERTELTLYFANEAGDALVKETRTVMRSSNTSMERLIMEQLIEGPESAGAYPTIPADVKLLNISISDSVCSINLDATFLNNTLPVANDIPIYSIVNSLLELSTVNRVQIRINGSQDAMFRDQISLNTTFERNYEYIEGGQ